MNSTALLSILLALGVGIAGILWGIKERNTAELSGGADASAALAAAEEDIGKLQADLDRVSDELGALKKENGNLRQELKIEKGTVEDLAKSRDRLLARLESHMAGGQPGKEGRDWTDEEIDLRVMTETMTVRIRELTMSGPVGYRLTDWEGMREALTTMPWVVAEEDAGRQSRAFAAMGFVPPGTDVRARTLDFLEGQLGAALYLGDGIMLFQEEGSLKSIHDRTALAVELTRYIQDSHFDLLEHLLSVPHNGDARQAFWSLAVGDSNLVRIRFQLQDTTAAAADELMQSPTKMTREQFERIPAFIRETLLFPFSLGERFCQVLHEKDRWTSVNDALAAPPWTTAEVLHPELYLAEEGFKSEQFERFDGMESVGGVTPIWDDVAGELRVALLLNQSNFLQRMADLGQPDILDMPELVSKGIEHFAERPGSQAAAGWLGDRFFVYPGEGDDAHVYWRSKWTNAEEAKEFAEAIRKALAFRHKIDLPGDGSWAAGAGRHVKVALLPEDEVLVIDAADAEFGRKLESNFNSPQPAGEDQ